MYKIEKKKKEYESGFDQVTYISHVLLSLGKLWLLSTNNLCQSSLLLLVDYILHVHACTCWICCE